MRTLSVLQREIQEHLATIGWQKIKIFLKIQKNRRGPSVQLPNNELIMATEAGELPFGDELSPTAKRVMVLPKLTSANLISIGQLCDDGCSIILDKTNMLAIKNNTIILKGKRNKLDGLWDIPIPKRKITANCCVSPIKHGSIYKRKPNEVSNVTRNTTPKQYKTTTFPSHLHKLQALAISNDFDNAIDEELKLRVQTPSPQPTTLRANIILQKKQTHMQLVTYLHACCFSPVKSTFKKAITKGFLKTFPGLTPQLVDKYLPPSVATAKGHLNQERQHLQSTKVTAPKNLHPIDDLCIKTQNLKLNNTVTI